MSKYVKLVTDKIDALGVKQSSRFFGVSTGTISNWYNGKSRPSLEAVEIALAEHDQEEWDDIKPEEPTAEAPVPLESWEGKDVIMLLPLYRGFSSDTHYTLFANYAKYGPEKIGMLMEKRTVIHESRNILIHKARKTNAKYYLFCDDDMILPCGSPELFNGRYGANLNPKLAAVNAISRIMSHPEDKRIVGSLYFGRHGRGKAQCCSGFANERENDNFRKGVYNGLKAEEWVGTGFLRIHHSVFDDMQKAIDAGKFPECKPLNSEMWYGFFNPLKVGVGEDVSFGRRAAELGIKSYVDTSLIALHCGEVFFGPNNTKN